MAKKSIVARIDFKTTQEKKYKCNLKHNKMALRLVT